MSLRSKIIEFLQDEGISFKEKTRTITEVPCPSCGREDKFSILKESGWSVCYRGSCDYGKKSFVEFLKLTGGKSTEEAREILFKKKEEVIDITEKIEISFDVDNNISLDEHVESPLETIPVIAYPEAHMLKIKDPMAKDGLIYLQGRGIDADMAEELKIYYSVIWQRVYLPIIIEGKVYGYQGRHIRKVDESLRMRNNEGFRRDTLVMFADSLSGSEHAIIAEGPFDAIKFKELGGYVSTLGKVVTEKQLSIILSYKPKKVYLALDDDAAWEMNDLVSNISLPVYRINVPESAKARCKELGKKADFGECTYEEAKEAFASAQKLGKNNLLVYFK